MSTFLNLSTSNILVEYIYYDPTAPDTISTSTAGFYLMEDGHNEENYVMNADGSESYTGNTRDRSAANIDTRNINYALLTTNKLGAAYNDYDPKLTDTASLPLSWASPEGIIYDTVRIHFIQGFSFNDTFDGVSLRVGATNRNGKQINLLNGVYSFQDNWINLNGKPFLYGGRQYATYIEYKVPALRFLKDSFKVQFQQGANADILAYKISDGVGFTDSANISIQAGLFSKFIKRDNQVYTTGFELEVTSISSSDEFNDVGVYIEDSTGGDYIEFYGTYNSAIFGDYMNALNTNGAKYIAIHDLVVSEQLPNTVGSYELIGYYNFNTNTPNLSDNVFLANFNNGAYWIASDTGYDAILQINMNKGDLILYDTSLPGAIKVRGVASDGTEFDDISVFVRTAEISYVQDSDFGDSNSFRPVLKYGGSALSFRIDYTLKILNVNTNASTDKIGSYVSFEPAKYGPELIKINLKDNIQSFDVYNKKIVNIVGNTSAVSSEDSNITGTDLYSKNITSFKETKDVNISVNTVIINEDNEIVDKSASGTKNVYGQNLASIFITPFDSYVLFNIFDVVEDELVSFDLSKSGLIYLNFAPSKGEVIKLAQENNESVKRESGQVLFRITKDTYQQIADSGNANFFITTKVGKNSAETLLYSGRFLDSTQKTTDDVQNALKNLNKTIQELKETVADQSLVIAQQQTTIKTSNSDAITYKEELEREIARRVSAGLTAARQTIGNTAEANDKVVNELASSVRGSSFNTYGPTNRGATANSGQTSR